MIMDQDALSQSLLNQTAQIVSSHLSNNPVPQDKIPELIREVYGTLTRLGSGADDAKNDQPLVPAVPIKQSVRPNHLVCLEDGRQLKMLKRHLMTAYNMTPDDYRKRWNLPHDYPMVAPNYAETRSTLAKQSGLGRSRRPAEITHEAVVIPPVEVAQSAQLPQQAVRLIPEGKRGPGRPRKVAAAA
jgi:predicted transcriptional regulator